MTEAEIDTIMEKACSTPQGELKASFILSDLAKIAPVYSDPATRPQAEAALAAWHESPDPLRKAMSLAWVARAKNAVAGAGQAVARATGASAVAGAARRGYAKAEGKAGDLGAAAGEKLARSKLGAKGMAASAEKGGLKAQRRMADSIQASEPKAGAFTDGGPQPKAYSGENDPRLSQAEHNTRFGGARPAQPRPAAGFSVPPAGTASGGSVHADALASAFRSGAEHASNLHAAAAARHGRVTARHAFKAGMALAGAGAAAAAAGTASRAMNGNDGTAAQPPRPARPGVVAKAAETDELEKGFASTVSNGARAAVGFGRKHAREAALAVGVSAASSALSSDDTPAPTPHVAKLKAMHTKPPKD